MTQQTATTAINNFESELGCAAFELVIVGHSRSGEAFLPFLITGVNVKEILTAPNGEESVPIQLLSSPSASIATKPLYSIGISQFLPRSNTVCAYGTVMESSTPAQMRVTFVSSSSAAKRFPVRGAQMAVALRRSHSIIFVVELDSTLNMEDSLAAQVRQEILNGKDCFFVLSCPRTTPASAVNALKESVNQFFANTKHLIEADMSDSKQVESTWNHLFPLLSTPLDDLHYHLLGYPSPSHFEKLFDELAAWALKSVDLAPVVKRTVEQISRYASGDTFVSQRIPTSLEHLGAEQAHQTILSYFENVASSFLTVRLLDYFSDVVAGVVREVLLLRPQDRLPFPLPSYPLEDLVLQTIRSTTPNTWLPIAGAAGGTAFVAGITGGVTGVAGAVTGGTAVGTGLLAVSGGLFGLAALLAYLAASYVPSPVAKPDLHPSLVAVVTELLPKLSNMPLSDLVSPLQHLFALTRACIAHQLKKM